MFPRRSWIDGPSD